MKILKTIILSLTVITCSVFVSCNDSKSYAELLTDENHACNAFLADQRVENEIPADSVFEIGEDAPYYRIDEEGNLYMQVLDAGDPNDKAEYDDLIYFRFMRLNLSDLYFYGEDAVSWNGNADNMASSPTSFRFQNYTLSSSSQYGVGIQAPLNFLGIGCRVNIVIKSQYGMTEELAYVIPFLYNIRYFRPQT
ncbi:MAG: DUF4827 family protein [Muribaculaceae bacterium]|nr:DUF4827 family protein [Muribaculaceae bacterium]